MKREKKELRYRIFIIVFVCFCAILINQKQAEASQITVSGNDTLPYTEVFGYVDVPHTTHSIFDEDKEIPIQYQSQIPAFYDARENNQITSVKKQNPWGNCWSFATLAALESSILSQGLLQDVDLSEYHLNYYNYKSVLDPLQGTKNDFVSGNGSFRQFLNGGGNVLVAYHALTNWLGAVDEMVTGYPTEEAIILDDTIKGAYMNDIVHLQQMYQINKEDVEAIKQEIINYGSVTAAFYYNNSYLNPDKAAYYNNTETRSNHAIAIIGWDDNYSKDNFLVKPMSDGAWLIKNSWGTSFGEEGYLWLSYEDASLQETMCVLIGESADNYDYNYQYDGSYMNKYLRANESITVANVFQVQEGNSKEAIRAVAFEIGNTNVDYSIQIYTNLSDVSIPTSGTPRLKEPLTGTIGYQGYYTVKLPHEVLVNPQESFSIVIEYKKEGTIYVTMEASTTWNNINFIAGAEENQSFYSLNDNLTWIDAGVRYNGNVRIKAFTDSTNEKVDVPVNGVKVAPSLLKMKVGEGHQLQASIEPENATNKDVLWSIADTSIAIINKNGYIEAKRKGKTVAVCTTKDGGYEAMVNIEIHNSIALDVMEIELTVGEKKQLVVSINGIEQDIMNNDKYEWKVDNTEVVNITDKGLSEGIGKGICKVICNSKEDNDEQASAYITIQTSFEDIRTTDWQYPYVMKIYEQQVMVGKTSKIFGTNQKLSRAEFVTLLYNYSGKPKVLFEKKFTDVPGGQWYSQPVTWAAQNKITAGYGNGSFGVSNSITREEFVMMLYSYAKSTGKAVHEIKGELSQFEDDKMVSRWAMEAMVWATQNEIISGKRLSSNGKMHIDPKGHATRGECATIMVKYGNKYK